MVLLHRRGHFRLDARSRRVVPRIVIASAIMGVLLWGMDEACASLYAGAFIERTLALIVVVSVAVVAFFILALVFGAVDWREIKQRLAFAATVIGLDLDPAASARR